MTTYTINGTTTTTLAEALTAAGRDTEITCCYRGTEIWTEPTDEHGALWLDASQCSALSDADLVALLNSQSECDETAISELLARGGKDADDYDDIGIMYLDAKAIAARKGFELLP